MNRRNFLKLAGGLAASGMTPSLAFAAQTSRLAHMPTTLKEVLACTRELTKSKDSVYVSLWMRGFARESFFKETCQKLFLSSEWKAFCKKHGDYILQKMHRPSECEKTLKSLTTGIFPSGDALATSTVSRWLERWTDDRAKMSKSAIKSCPSWAAFAKKFPAAAEKLRNT